MARRGAGSTTVSSAVGSSRNTLGMRMEVYNFLSHRISAVHTVPSIQEMLPCTQPHTLNQMNIVSSFQQKLCKALFYKLKLSFLISSPLCSILDQHWIKLRSFKTSFSGKNVTRTVDVAPAVWLPTMWTVLPTHREWKTQSKDTHRAWFLGHWSPKAAFSCLQQALKAGC